MNEYEVHSAAKLLADAWRESTTIDHLPHSLRPTSFKDAYAIQDAMAELMNAAQVQEQFILDRNTYSATVAGLGIDATSNEGHYTISVDAETTTCPITRCYSLTATAVGAQANDTQCASFTLTSAGIKTATDSVGNSANDCWSR